MRTSIFLYKYPLQSRCRTENLTLIYQKAPPPKSAITIGWSKYISFIRSGKIDFPYTHRGSPSAVVNVSAISAKIDLKLKVSYISFDKRDTDEPVSTSIFVLTPPISTLANQQLLETADNLTKDGFVKSLSVIFLRAGLLAPSSALFSLNH